MKENLYEPELSWVNLLVYNAIQRTVSFKNLSIVNSVADPQLKKKKYHLSLKRAWTVTKSGMFFFSTDFGQEVL